MVGEVALDERPEPRRTTVRSVEAEDRVPRDERCVRERCGRSAVVEEEVAWDASQLSGLADPERVCGVGIAADRVRQQ